MVFEAFSTRKLPGGTRVQGIVSRIHHSILQDASYKYQTCLCTCLVALLDSEILSVAFSDVVDGEGQAANEGDVVVFNYVCRRANGYFVYRYVIYLFVLCKTVKSHQFVFRLVLCDGYDSAQ